MSLAQADVGLPRQEDKLHLAQHSLELEICKAYVEEHSVSIADDNGCCLYLRSAEKHVWWETKGQSSQGFGGHGEATWHGYAGLAESLQRQGEIKKDRQLARIKVR